jgi:hypothetical protein
VDYFHHDKQKSNGFSSICKRCSIEKTGARKKTDRGKLLTKASNIRNIKTIRAYAKKMRPVLNERAKIRSRTDPSFQLDRRMRSLMWASLKKNKGGRSWQDLAGYSVDDLRSHIEKQFRDGMSWELFLSGEIHIDHKIPRSVFNYSSPENLDFKRCWSLENLQPMWAIDNIKKSNKLNKPFQPSLLMGGV